MIQNTLNLNHEIPMIQENNDFNQNNNNFSSYFSLYNVIGTISSMKTEDINNSNDFYFSNQIPSRRELENKKENIKYENMKNQSDPHCNLPISKKEKYSNNITYINNEKEIDKSNNLINGNILKQKRIIKKNVTKHNKYADDNLRRKCRGILLNIVLEYINEKINAIYEGKIGNGILKKELLPLNQFPKKDNTIEFNKNLMYKTLKQIFSGDISTKYSYYLLDHNKEIIFRLLNDKDEKKRNYFKKLFNIKFIQCVEQFNGKKNYDELQGFKLFNDIKHKYEYIYSNEPEYIDKLEEYLKNFEDIITNKRGRKSKSIIKITLK